MSYSDEDWDRETSVEHQESDQKMKQYWAKKARRRSSLFKIPVGDSLGLKEHAKIGMLLAKNGELVSSCSTPRCSHAAAACIVEVGGAVRNSNRDGSTVQKIIHMTDSETCDV